MNNELYPKFVNKDGSLTRYSFGCGYMEVSKKTDNTTDLELKLWHEGACFHVRLHDFYNHKRIFWECFDKLTDARKFFKNESRKLSRG